MGETKPTEHPYVVIQSELGIPLIRDTRITVHLVASYYRRNAAAEKLSGIIQNYRWLPSTMP